MQQGAIDGRRGMASLAVGAAVGISLVLALGAPGVEAAKPPKPGKYAGKISGGFFEQPEIGQVSFTLKGIHLKDFKIVLFGEPFCSEPVPDSWPYPLPQSADFRVLEDFQLAAGNQLFPDGSELSYGLYPFPIVEESHNVGGYMDPFDGQFTTKKKVVGTMFIASDEFVSHCRYLIPGADWSATRKG